MKYRLGVLLCIAMVTSVRAEDTDRFVLVVTTFSCNAATLSRVQGVVSVSPDEAFELIAGEQLCVEESRKLVVGAEAVVPTEITIVKPPASTDMAEAGYLVVIKELFELDAREIPA